MSVKSSISKLSVSRPILYSFPPKNVDPKVKIKSGLSMKFVLIFRYDPPLSNLFFLKDYKNVVAVWFLRFNFFFIIAVVLMLKSFQNFSIETIIWILFRFSLDPLNFYHTRPRVHVEMSTVQSVVTSK